MTCAAPFFLGTVRFGGEPPWTDRVTEAQKTGLSRGTGLYLPKGSRFLLYGEDDGRDLHVYYKLRLTDGELHTLLVQRPFRHANWGREVATVILAGAAPIPGWNPGRSRKTRSTEVSFERKPGEGEATYLNITIDPREDGTDDVYLELDYS